MIDGFSTLFRGSYPDFQPFLNLGLTSKIGEKRWPQR
jgi:hypothetical protein